MRRTQKSCWKNSERGTANRERVVAGMIFVALLGGAAAGHAQTAEDVRHGLVMPPADSRPMMRWWWFGPAVVDTELAREMKVMQAAGIGGVEIQPVYALSLDDPAKGIKNTPYLSPEFLRDVRFADETGRALGMRVDITLGSGWPYGGPGTTLALSAGKLKLVVLPVSGREMMLPAAAEGDSFIAAFHAQGTAEHWQAQGATRLMPKGSGGGLELPQGAAGVVLVFYSSHTRQQVKRAAVGAEGYVLDHFSRPAIDEHLHDVADKLAGAFGTQPPYSVFSDSLEVYGSDWTSSLPAEFKHRRGYDVVPLLPELWSGDTAEAAAVRHDWGQTLSDLIRENYLVPINTWAEAHQTKFRSQTYGEPAVTLADEAVPALPEGEGPQWRQFSYTRWASSASHLYGRNVTSAETFTWLHSPVFRATPLDMKVEIDRMFLSGVNQIIGHGWPYTPPAVAEPGWNLYAAAVFNDHNPWFAVMPDVTAYMHRGSWLLRQGKPVTDVALLLPEDDAQAAFSPGHVSVTDEMKKRVMPELMQAIEDAGYNVDYVDAASLEKLGRIDYPVVVMPPTERMSLKMAKQLAAYTAAGGHVIAVGQLPHLAPGLVDVEDPAIIGQTMKTLFASGTAAQQVASTSELPAALHRALPADLSSTALPDPAQAGNDPNAGLGFVHRKLSDGDLYFVVNSTNRPLDTKLTFRSEHGAAARLSLETGLPVGVPEPSRGLAAHFEPYESRVYLLDSDVSGGLMGGTGPVPFSVSESPWTVQFTGSAEQPWPVFKPVNTLPGREFYSGAMTYRDTVTVGAGFSAGASVVLDFGNGSPTSDTRRPGSAGISALLDAPVRDAAIVMVNGKRVAAVWHPPYRLELGAALKPGANTLEIQVFNTAVNELAGQPPRDYTALNAKYGKRFDPQDMDKIRSLPSGLLEAPTLHVAGDGR